MYKIANMQENEFYMLPCAQKYSFYYLFIQQASADTYCVLLAQM